MKHQLQVKIEKKTFTNQIGKEVEYTEVYLVLDGYMNIRLDKTKDNYKNLINIINLGQEVEIV